ncbi:MAG: sulfurtransferase TusA family protein [Candidatus Bathyarchaeota archaeon]|nr:sulfurtransferase TusA family protein [Candidatus Bathyarchaeota archaeon]
MTPPTDKTLDLTGLYCPEPIFRTRIQLDNMKPGQTLKITADDPAAEEDIQRLIKRLGHTILEIQTDHETIQITIRKT